MTVKDLRTLVDNLDEYIHIPGGIDRLKKTILHLAVSGQLVPQDPSEGTGQELYDQIQAEKQKLIAEGKLKKQKPLPEITEEEIPFEIPNSWKWARLGEVTKKIGSGSTPRGGKSVYTIDGPIFIRSQNVWNDGLRTVNVARINQETHKIMSNTLVLANDVLLNITGASIGRSSIVPENIGEANVSQHVSIVRPVFSKQARLIHLIFISNYFQKMIDNFQVGVSREGLSKQSMEKMLIPVPTLKEQIRIAEKVNIIFKLLDDLHFKYLAEQAERRKFVVSSMAMLAKGSNPLALDMLVDIIKTKEDVVELRKTILHLAVSGQLVPQDPSEGTGEELYKQIQAEKQKLIAQGKLKKQKPLPVITEDEITFKIPKSWKWVRLGELGEFGSGSTPARGEDKYYGGDINWFKSGELTDTYMIKNSEESIKPLALKECSLRINKPGDIVIAMYGATAGKLGLLEVEGTTNQAVCGFTLFDRVDRLFTFNSLLAYRESLIRGRSAKYFKS